MATFGPDTKGQAAWDSWLQTRGYTPENAANIAKAYAKIEASFPVEEGAESSVYKLGVGPGGGGDRTIDQVIVNYLRNRGSLGSLHMIGEGIDTVLFEGGKRVDPSQAPDRETKERWKQLTNGFYGVGGTLQTEMKSVGWLAGQNRNDIGHSDLDDGSGTGKNRSDFNAIINYYKDRGITVTRRNIMTPRGHPLSVIKNTIGKQDEAGALKAIKKWEAKNPVVTPENTVNLTEVPEPAQEAEGMFGWSGVSQVDKNKQMAAVEAIDTDYYSDSKAHMQGLSLGTSDAEPYLVKDGIF